MLETIDPMSPKEMEKVLKYLPEPTEVEVTLSNFGLSDVEKQANELYPNLNLKFLGYQSLEGRLENPSKEKILEIYKKERFRSGMEVDKRFICFKKAKWNLKNLIVQVDPFHVLVKYTGDMPDYINKMCEELIDTFVDYKFEQTRTIY